MITKVSILLILFIFGLITPGWTDEVKSTNNMINQEIIIKLDKNKAILQKKKDYVKTADKSSGMGQNRSRKMIPYIDYGAMMGKPVLSLNFLKAVPKVKALRGKIHNAKPYLLNLNT